MTTHDTFWAKVKAQLGPLEPLPAYDRLYVTEEILDEIDRLGNPAALTIDDISNEGMASWLYQCRGKVRRELAKAGYVVVRNERDGTGRWLVGKRRRVIFARRELAQHDQVAAARKLVASRRRGWSPAPRGQKRSRIGHRGPVDVTQLVASQQAKATGNAMDYQDTIAGRRKARSGPKSSNAPDSALDDAGEASAGGKPGP